MRARSLLSFSAFASLFPAIAMAEPTDEELPDAESVYSGDFLILGAGAIYAPDYEGADEYKIKPAAGFRARIGGVGLYSSGIGVGADLIPSEKGQKVAFSLGPVVRYRSDRAGKVKDPVVRLLPRLNRTWEAGVSADISIRDLITGKDALSFGADVRWTVSGNKGARTITTGVSYFTPVSSAMAVGVSVGMDHVNHKYADYHYTVDEAGSTASGLPEYQGKGGWKNWSSRIYIGYDLDGNIRNGGWAVGGMVNYLRLRGSAAETPITSIRGDRDQWMVGAGLAYTF
jgi:outer membrane scaffolding protein for murein synthesis (MipA/OmpV family)